MDSDSFTWTAFATIAITFTAVATALAVCTRIRRKSSKGLRDAPHKTEVELETATKRSDTNASVKQLREAEQAEKA